MVRVEYRMPLECRVPVECRVPFECRVPLECKMPVECRGGPWVGAGRQVRPPQGTRDDTHLPTHTHTIHTTQYTLNSMIFTSNFIIYDLCLHSIVYDL